LIGRGNHQVCAPKLIEREETMSETPRKWKATAPSNIALIKYMGKTDHSGNRPTNASLSYTLPHLKSLVEIELAPGAATDRWEPLREYEGRPLAEISLSEKGKARFLAHLLKLKAHYGFEGSFVVRSANDFPSDCGLASSASSFAALTMAALDALSACTGRQPPSVTEAADWSRQGSGSSCRSFFAPWSVWSEEGAVGVSDLGYGNLLHQVVVVDQEIKAVSSSEAHRRVTSSRLFEGRPERADQRVRELVAALKAKNWREAFEITWAEFWDMHALFETSQPSFGYMTAGSLEVLRLVRERCWDRSGMGPLVTMDAGPNVHLLWQNDGAGLNQAREIGKALSGKYPVISNLDFIAGTSG
jgi:diphosphomevalonate decarboxylase